MSVGILIDGGEKHIVRNVQCTVTNLVENTSGFGSVNLGQDVTCTMRADTQPKMMKVYKLILKDGPTYERFQILGVAQNGSVFLVSGAKLSDSSLLP